MRKVIVVLIALLLIFCSIFVTGKFIYSRSGNLTETKNIFIPKGNTETIFRNLVKEGVFLDNFIENIVFRTAVKLTADKGLLHSGEFEFPKNASMQQIIAILRHAKPVQHELTIPEGLTVYQMTQLINNAPYMQGHIDVPKEGSILPQTYAYEWGYSREKLLQHMQHAMKNTVENIWENRSPIDEVKTPSDMVTLASIVEKETGLPRERPMIARVFINRLHLGMKLQSDPTTIYALTNGQGNLDRLLTRHDWEIASPYNTYWTPALPPGPICSPGAAALQAVAHPVDGNMLYFVANGTGGHSFSNTLSEHNHNVEMRKKNK